MDHKIIKSEEEWKKQLSAQQYRILREKGTETSFTGKYCYNKENGIYLCVACGNELFVSNTKYDSGSGWPSFYEAVGGGNVTLNTDASHGMMRTEVACASCGGHLGHMFDDGPKPTGKRFCINSVALNFKKHE